MRNVPLAERRGDAAALADQITEHKRSEACCVGGECADLKAMRAELKEIRAEIRTWFAPSPDASTLF